MAQMAGQVLLQYNKSCQSEIGADLGLDPPWQK